jgi:hypothetical protein
MMETLPAAPKKSTMLLGVVLLLAILFSFAFFGGPLIKLITGETKLSATVFYGTRLLFWTSMIFIFVYAAKVEKQKVLTWEEKKYPFWVYIVSILAIYFAIIVIMGMVSFILLKLGFEKESAKSKEILAVFEQNQLLIFFTAITAGIVEEFTFRGYLLPRMEILFRNPWIAITVSSLLFGLMHFGYGTIFQVVGPFVIGFIFAFYYWKFRNIKVIILAHIFWDLMAIYLKILLKDAGLDKMSFF